MLSVGEEGRCLLQSLDCGCVCVCKQGHRVSSDEATRWREGSRPAKSQLLSAWLSEKSGVKHLWSVERRRRPSTLEFTKLIIDSAERDPKEGGCCSLFPLVKGGGAGGEDGARRGACWLLAGGWGQGRAVGTDVPGYTPWEQEQGTMLPDSGTGNRNKEHSSQIQGQGTGTGTNGTVRSQSLGTDVTGTRIRNTPP